MKTGTSVNGNKNWYYVSGKGWVSGAYPEVTNNNASEAEKKTTVQASIKNEDDGRIECPLGCFYQQPCRDDAWSRGDRYRDSEKERTSVEGNKTWYYVSGKGWVSGAYLTTTSSSSNNSGSTTTNQK